MKLNDYIVCCSWHSPKNAIVKIRTGEVVPENVLKRTPDTPWKDQIIHSGGFCDPCAKRFLEGEKGKPLVEDILVARPMSR